MEYNIKEIVKGNTARLAYCQGGKLYYTITIDRGGWVDEDTHYTFPVDITDRGDVGDARFELSHKAITLMRYIRKAIKSDELRIGF